ncbi:MAG: transketolase family protein [Candidatus Aenigmarchaeota archaeon]|nr:transketolase family protein [Candidatus Aenigmarchaeota archaeon]
MRCLRDAYGDTLVKIGGDKRIVVLDADLSKSTKTCKFAEKYPERFFNFGVCEQDMMGTAAGFASCGKIPFVSTFAIFASGRAWEQVRNTIAYSNLNVRIVATHCGLNVGEDGASHQCIEDIALMRAIGNMRVVAPADAIETEKAIIASLDEGGPFYFRLPRSKVPVLFDENYNFKLYNGEIMRDGSDIYIIACGIMVNEAMKAAEILKEKGIDAGVINMHTIKPIDKECIVKAAKKTGRIVTCEDHSIFGGLGSAVAEVLSSNYPTKMRIIGMKGFGESGPANELFRKYGLDGNGIANEIEKMR